MRLKIRKHFHTHAPIDNAPRCWLFLLGAIHAVENKPMLVVKEKLPSLFFFFLLNDLWKKNHKAKVRKKKTQKKNSLLGMLKALVWIMYLATTMAVMGMMMPRIPIGMRFYWQSQSHHIYFAGPWTSRIINQTPKPPIPGKGGKSVPLPGGKSCAY